MIPSQTFENYPIFGSNATKVEPGDAKKAAGWQQADVVPAEWMNWAWYKNTKGITDLNRGLSSVENEIINVLTEYGITPSEAVEDQLKKAILTNRIQFADCTSAASDVAKTVAIENHILKAGNIYIINMTYANMVANPTLSINSGTAYPICNTQGIAVGIRAWQANYSIILIFTGTKFLMLTLGTTDVIEEGNPNPPTSYAVWRLLPPGSVIPYAGQYVPFGFLECNGAAVSRTEYAILFLQIGTLYGAGDGSTTFNLPDYREVSLVGKGQNTQDTIATHDVYQLGEFKDDQLQSHTHSYYKPKFAYIATNVGTQATNQESSVTGAATGRTGDVTRGKRKGVMYLIKY
jgi:microcystin-dependent protein/antitoxin component of RelBE/YafQ-DinJ toxin-antitoxin module